MLTWIVRIVLLVLVVGLVIFCVVVSRGLRDG